MSHPVETPCLRASGWALLLILGGPACAPTQAELHSRVLTDYVNQLQGQMERLQRRVESLSHEVSVCQAISPPKAAAPSASAPAPVAPAPVTAAQAFDQALSAYQEGATARAFAAFSAWLQAHPAHAWADRARYWMGQTKFDLGEYAAAAEQFGRLPESYPSSQKTPDALLKLGLAFERLHQDERATVTFAQLVAQYPRSASADLARSRLKATEARHARR